MLGECQRSLGREEDAVLGFDEKADPYNTMGEQ